MHESDIAARGLVRKTGNMSTPVRQPHGPAGKRSVHTVHNEKLSPGHQAHNPDDNASAAYALVYETRVRSSIAITADTHIHDATRSGRLCVATPVYSRAWHRGAISLLFLCTIIGGKYIDYINIHTYLCVYIYLRVRAICFYLRFFRSLCIWMR